MKLVNLSLFFNTLSTTPLVMETFMAFSKIELRNVDDGTLDHYTEAALVLLECIRQSSL